MIVCNKCNASLLNNYDLAWQIHQLIHVLEEINGLNKIKGRTENETD